MHIRFIMSASGAALRDLVRWLPSCRFLSQLVVLGEVGHGQVQDEGDILLYPAGRSVRAIVPLTHGQRRFDRSLCIAKDVCLLT